MLASDWEQVWSSFVVILLGYFCGTTDFPDVDKWLLPIVLAIISIAPSIFHSYQESKSSKR